MRRYCFPKLIFICTVAFFIIPAWAAEAPLCDADSRIDATGIDNKFTVRAGWIGVAKAKTDQDYPAAIQDVYLNGCALDIKDDGFPYIEIERVVSLTNEDVMVLKRTVQATACSLAYSLLAVKPNGSARETGHFYECGDPLQLADFKANGDQLSFVDKNSAPLTTYRYQDGWVDCEPCEPDTSNADIDTLAGKLGIQAKSDELNQILLNGRAIGIAGEPLAFVAFTDQQHQSSRSPKIGGNQFVLAKKGLPPKQDCAFKYILMTIRPDKSVQTSDEFGNCNAYLNATADEQGLAIRFPALPNGYPEQTVTVRDGKLVIEGAPVAGKPSKPESFNSLPGLYRDLADKLYKDVHNVEPENEADIDEFAETIGDIAQASTYTLSDKRKMLAIQLPSVNDFFEIKPTCKDQSDCTTAFYFVDQDRHYLPVGLPLTSIGGIKPDLAASPPRLAVKDMDYDRQPPVEKTFCYVLKSLASGYPEEFLKTTQSVCESKDNPAQPQAAKDKQCLSYDVTEKLVGVIVRATYPGRPNYESIEDGDEAETGLYLDLNEPVCTLEPTDEVNEAKSEVKRIQLVVKDKDMYERLSALQGSLIAVQGRLFSSISGHHHAPLLLEDLSLLEIKSVKFPLRETNKK